VSAMAKEIIYHDTGPGDYFVTTERSSSGQVNEYAGRASSGEHCHMWYNPSTGERGIEHRGHCRVCEDQKSGSK
jgi:hypothetical protein